MIRVYGVLLLILVQLVTGTYGANVSSATPLDVGTLALPPGHDLPNDAECAGRVLASAEARPGNTQFNQTRGHQKHLAGAFLSRVTGNFTGTTDEAIQWAACKWGIEADVVRAQAVEESGWQMTVLGDFTDDRRWCAPGHLPGVDGKPGCPQSVGILQTKYRYTVDAFPEAAESTAYNLDYVLGVWRTCFEGQETWLADDPPASGYGAGDMWGCLGRWYAGDWRSDMALGYIDRVQQRYRERAWEAF
jgi:autotransporter family porin